MKKNVLNRQVQRSGFLGLPKLGLSLLLVGFMGCAQTTPLQALQVKASQTEVSQSEASQSETLGAEIAHTSHQVAPAHEHRSVAAQALAGPSETQGIIAMKALGNTDLAADFPAMAGHILRVREIHLAPGGVVAAHTHEARPGVAYILSGEILEHRSDAEEPLLRRAGDVAFERSGLSHWWENASDEPVHALVVDVFAPDAAE